MLVVVLLKLLAPGMQQNDLLGSFLRLGLEGSMFEGAKRPHKQKDLTF